MADLVLDGLEDLLRCLDPGARRRTNMQLDHAAIDGRIEIATDKGEHHHAKREDENGDDRNDGAAGQQRPEQFDIALPQPLEAALERGVETGKEGFASGPARSAAMLALQHLADRDRR